MTITSNKPRPSGLGGLQTYLGPCVRRLVEVNDVDVASICGTGRDGRVRKADVVAHLRSPTAYAGGPAGAARAVDRSAARTPPAFMTAEADLTGGPISSTEEALAALTGAAGRVLALASGPGGPALPDEWSSSLSVSRPGAGRPIIIPGHLLLSGPGLVRAIEDGGPVDDVDDGRVDEDAEPSGLSLTVTSHPSLLAEIFPLREDEAACLALGAAIRRPVAVTTGAGEALAIRSVATLTLTYDSGHLRSDAAAWFVTTLADVLGEEAGSTAQT